MNLNFFKNIKFYYSNLIGTELFSEYEINYFIHNLKNINFNASYNVLNFETYKNNLIIDFNKKPLNFCLDKFLADYKNFNFLLVKNISIETLNDAVLLNSIVDYFLNSDKTIFIPCLNSSNSSNSSNISILNVYDSFMKKCAFPQSYYIEIFKLRLKLLCFTRLIDAYKIYPESINVFLHYALQHGFCIENTKIMSENLILKYLNLFQITIKLDTLNKLNFSKKFSFRKLESKNNKYAINLIVYSNYYEIYFNPSSLINKIAAYIAHIKNNFNNLNNNPDSDISNITKSECRPDLDTNLSKIQNIAASEIDNPVLIVAGAGSGKTKVIVNKFLYLLNYLSPYEILVLTFTNNAVNEIKNRIFKTLNLNDDEFIVKNNLKIYTYHSFFYSIIKIYYKYLGFQNVPEIYAKNNYKNNTKNNAFFSENYDSSSYSNNTDGIKNFDDILKYALKLFENEDILIEISKRYKYILIDEYQDLNILSDIIIKKIDYGRGNITYAGDDDQSIYRFNGGDSTNLLSFDLFYPFGKVFLLQSNYRSNETIINFSNNIIKKIDFRYPKLMTPGNNTKNNNTKNTTGDLQLKNFYLNFIKTYAYNFSIFKSGANNWILTNKEIEPENSVYYDFINLINFKNYTDEIEFNINLLIVLLNSGFKAAILTRTIREEIDYKKFLEYYMKMPSKNNLNSKYIKNAFIGTIHKSKGMEFNSVILSNFSSANFPKTGKINNNFEINHPFSSFYRFQSNNYKNIDDERRLFYVGATRARDIIFITYTGDKSVFIDFK
ncbi:MAG: UvrD-helicase domain-containing protein [bacterium]